MFKQRDAGFLRAVLDAMPNPVFVVDEDVRILDYNQAAIPLLGDKPDYVLQQRGGDALHCIQAVNSPQGCGRAEQCRTCIIRDSVRESCSDRRIVRQGKKMTLVRGERQVDAYVLVSTSPFHYEGRTLVILTLEDISDLVELRKLIPICANCKKIRNEKEYWDTIEEYFKNHMDLDFTHGICPDCFARLYPDLAQKMGDSHRCPLPRE
jgi:hypothetical protein